MKLSPDLQNSLFLFQKDEISSHHTYNRLASMTKNEANREVLKKIARQEMRHYEIWKAYTGRDVKPNWSKVRFYYWVSHLFGLTFGIKLMERGELNAQSGYNAHLMALPEIEQVLHEEEVHENELLAMIDEESLKYAGSVVLGLNDALVELTGALAGLTLAFQNTRIIALAGLITGISASFSMAASEYLSTKAEGSGQDPNKSALYTGIAYVFTVLALIAPYLMLKSYILCLALTICIAIAIIAIFNYYISVAKDLKFRRRFLEMSAISLGVALLSFVIGFIIRNTLGINL
jgi:VIT1/CCC1 family predicted Fe2+/Mn2+ transporter